MPGARFDKVTDTGCAPAFELALVVDKTREEEQIVELTVYVTTLVMNFFARRRFERRKKQPEAETDSHE